MPTLSTAALLEYRAQSAHEAWFSRRRSKSPGLHEQERPVVVGGGSRTCKFPCYCKSLPFFGPKMFPNTIVGGAPIKEGY